MFLSVVVPTYTINPQLEKLALGCIASLGDQPDEIIVVEDGGLFSHKLATFADTYIYNTINKGFTANVNRGWRYATGDYVAIVNSDTELRSGSLFDLCIPNIVSSPTIVNEYVERLAGPFFVVPKEIKEARGMLLEEFKNYCSDSEYDHRVEDIFQRVPTVKIFHHMGQTTKAAGIDVLKETEKDREVYQRLREEGRAT